VRQEKKKKGKGKIGVPPPPPVFFPPKNFRRAHARPCWLRAGYWVRNNPLRLVNGDDQNFRTQRAGARASRSRRCSSGVGVDMEIKYYPGDIALRAGQAWAGHSATSASFDTWGTESAGTASCVDPDDMHTVHLQKLSARRLQLFPVFCNPGDGNAQHRR